MKRWRLLFAAPALTACQPGAQSASIAPDNMTARAEAPSPFGTWRIVQVNDRQAATDRSDGGPTVTLGPGSFEGNTGCNSFGGTSLVQNGRFFANWPVATERGCGDLTAQEEAIFRLLISGPRLEWAGADSLRLISNAGSLRLERIAAVARDEADAGPPMLLAGTRWIIVGANGAQVAMTRAATPYLQFEADDWSLALACGKVTGRWQQREDEPILKTVERPRACDSDATANAVGKMLGHPLAYTAGMNRELVLAGAGNFLAGRFDHEFEPNNAQLLTGKWLVRAIDGRPPGRSPVPPNIIVSRASYGAWDGCNHREGIYLTHARQLFAHGSGLSTLANCQREQVSPQVNAVLANQPRIARTTDGLALISRAGRLDLQRVSSRAYPDPSRTGLRAGMKLELAVAGGPARLDLSNGRRFGIVLPCGTLQGDWRPGQPARFSMEPAERHAPKCPTGPGTLVRQMERMFGDVQAVVDGNNQRVLLLNEDQALAANVVRP